MPADHSEPDSGERQAVAQGSQQQHSGTWDHREYARLLRRIDLFEGLDRVVLAKLAAHLQPLAYPSSSIVFRQGDAGDAFYVVASGTVGVYVTDRSGAVETRLTVLHAGEPFGEMALLSNIPRSATIGLVASIVWVYRPAAGERQASSQRKQSLELQHALLGPMSREEKIAVGVGIGLLAGFITEPLHRAHPAWVAVLATGVLAATRVVTANTLRAVNWNFALLFGVLISLATVFARTGLDRWITDRVTVAMGDLKSIRVAFLLLLTLFCFAISFVVRWQAAAPLVTIAMTPIASAAGVHPFIVGVIAVIACNGFWVPYQSTTYLALYAGTAGQVFSHGQARPAAIAYGVWTLVAVTLSVPVWRWMGLL